MLGINKLCMGYLAKDKPKSATNTEDSLGKPPSLMVAKGITDALTEPLEIKYIAEKVGVTYAVIATALRYMIKKGDILVIGNKRILTGADTTLNELLAKPHRSNMGVTGVSFNKKTNIFYCSYGRGASFTFKSFLDAACKRKSLEVN